MVLNHGHKNANIRKGILEYGRSLSSRTFRKLQDQLEEQKIIHRPSLEQVQFSYSAVTDSLWPHGLQHARPPDPSPTPGIHSNSCPSSQWCHPAISSSVFPFSSCPQSRPHQGLSRWVNSSHEVAKVLEFQLQHRSFRYSGLISFRMDW